MPWRNPWVEGRNSGSVLWAIRELIAAHTPACVIPSYTLRELVIRILELRNRSVLMYIVSLLIAYLAQTQMVVPAMANL